MKPTRPVTVRDAPAQSDAPVPAVVNGRSGVGRPFSPDRAGEERGFAAGPGAAASRGFAAGPGAAASRGFAAGPGTPASRGFEAGPGAPASRGRRTTVVGVLVADFEPFSTEVLNGVADAVRGTGFELVLHSAGGLAHAGWERHHLSRMSGASVAGAILVTPTVTDITYAAPIVAVDPHAGRSELPTVDADNWAGAKTGVEYLLGLGHRRIAMITGRADLRSAQLREGGYRQALAEAAIPVDESLVRLGSFDPQASREAAYALLTRADRPTAIFAANDQTALAAIDVATDLGLRVPDDLSLVGFDNIPESALAQPPLTTVEQPIRQMGHAAMELLVSLIRGQSSAAAHLTLATRLVVRASARAR